MRVWVWISRMHVNRLQSHGKMGDGVRRIPAAWGPVSLAQALVKQWRGLPQTTPDLHTSTVHYGKYMHIDIGTRKTIKRIVRWIVSSLKHRTDRLAYLGEEPGAKWSPGAHAWWSLDGAWNFGSSRTLGGREYIKGSATWVSPSLNILRPAWGAEGIGFTRELQAGVVSDHGIRLQLGRKNPEKYHRSHSKSGISGN